jgi:excisionase family DNA binding protein
MSTRDRSSTQSAAQGEESGARGSGEVLVATMERSLETVRQAFGASHRHYVDALDHYAKALFALGELERAAETSLRASRIRDANDAATPPIPSMGSSDGVPRVLDARRAARYLSLGLDTLYRLVRAGELPHTRIGKSIRFRPEDLDEYIAARVTREWTRVDRRGRPKQKTPDEPA